MGRLRLDTFTVLLSPSEMIYNDEYDLRIHQCFLSPNPLGAVHLRVLVFLDSGLQPCSMVSVGTVT